MKFERFDIQIWKNTWYLLPTVAVITDDLMYGRHNLMIQVHFLCFHCRWLWLVNS